MSHLPLHASPALAGFDRLPGRITLASERRAPDPALAALDDPDEWRVFSRAVVGLPGVWESSVAFEGADCAVCALTIEDALTAAPGVEAVEVDAAGTRGRVRWIEGATSPSRWMQAALDAGYRALPASDAGHAERRRKAWRRMVWRWAVAGMGMMQVMMYSLPVYLSTPGEIAPDQLELLRWASWVLTLPVLLFSCGPFFANAWRDLTHRAVSMDLPVAAGIAIAFLVSTAGTFDPHGLFGAEVWFDSLTMFVFFLLSGRLLEMRLADRTAGALDALANRLPDSVERRADDGSYARVSVRRLRAGDVIRVLPGEAFPADGHVLEGDSWADEALLTGESRPLARGVGATVLAGSHNLAAPLVVCVDKTGDATRFAEIVALIDSAATTRPALARVADRIAKPFIVAVLAAAAAAAAWWWGEDPGRALMTAAAVLVVTCPCALSLATPAALLAAAGSLARRGILVRRLDALEALAEVDAFAFDKTGTLTRDAFQLTEVRTRDGVSRDEALALAAALARHSLHPVSRALAAAAGERGARDENGVSAVVDENGAPAAVVEEVAGQGLVGTLARGDGTRTLRLGSAAFCGVHPEPLDALVAYLSDDAGHVASFAFAESLREDAAATVAGLAAEGNRVFLLSGDRAGAVRRAGERLSIEAAHGDLAPADKLAFLRELQGAGRRVAMVGDGLNDGPVLAGADVSFSFGSGVPLARARADFVIAGERLEDVAVAHTLARRAMRVVRQNLAWAALYNVACVPLAMAGWLPAWAAGLGMAASSFVVVANAARLAPRRRPVTEDNDTAAAAPGMAPAH